MDVPGIVPDNSMILQEILTTLKHLQTQIELLRKEVNDINVKGDRTILAAKAALDKIERM